MSETRKLVCDQLRPLNRDGLLGLDLDETGVGDGGVVAGRGDGDDLLGPGPVVQLDHGPVRRRVGEVVRGLAVLGVTTRKCANCPAREAAAMLARSAI
jgi:hypothetical protein